MVDDRLVAELCLVSPAEIDDLFFSFLAKINLKIAIVKIELNIVPIPFEQ